MPVIPLSGEISAGHVSQLEMGAGQESAPEKDFFTGELLSKMAGGPKREHKCRFIRRKQRAATREL